MVAPATTASNLPTHERRDHDAARRMREWAGGNQTTPTFDIDGTIIVDFEKEELDKALGLV